MGSSGSKASSGGAATSSSSGSGRTGRFRGHRVFQSSCLGTASRSRDCDNDDHHQVRRFIIP